MKYIIPLLAFWVVSCGPVYKTDYRFTTPPTSEGKLCANSCLDKMQYCKSTCKNEELQCEKIATLESENAYYRYLEERRQLGRPIKKDRSDFARSCPSASSCTKECDQTQRICHSNCGGNIIETRTCQAFCD